MTAPRKPGAPWRPLTRRAFVASLGAAAAAAAALAVTPPGALRTLGAAAGDGDEYDDDLDRPRRPWSDKPRWIGHC